MLLSELVELLIYKGFTAMGLSGIYSTFSTIITIVFNIPVPDWCPNISII